MSENPYAAPETEEPYLGVETSAEVTRRAHLSNESSLKTIGVLFLLGAVFICVSALMSLSNPDGAHLGGPLILGAIGLVQIWTGWNLRKLKARARIPAILFSVLGLVAIPIGTIISAYFLYLLCNKKASVIFSPAYKEIIAQTPHVKFKTSKITWAILIILLAVLAGTIVFATMSS